MVIKQWATDTARLWVLRKKNHKLNSIQPSPGSLPGGTFWNEIQRGRSEAEQMGKAQVIQGVCISWKLQYEFQKEDQGQRQCTCVFTELQLHTYVVKLDQSQEKKNEIAKS